MTVRELRNWLTNFEGDSIIQATILYDEKESVRLEVVSESGIIQESIILDRE